MAVVGVIVISVVATIVQECSMAVVLMIDISYLTVPSCMHLKNSTSLTANVISLPYLNISTLFVLKLTLMLTLV